MSSSARDYRRTHAPADESLRSVLPHFESLLHEGADAPRIARDVHLPVAATRGALSSFADTGASDHGAHICAGTSCLLAADHSLARDLQSRCRARPVYCLGYCDRSPVAMTRSGRVVPHLSRDTLDDVAQDRPVPHPPAPSVRCTSREPIVTARLLHPSAPPEHCPEYAALLAARKLDPADVVECVVRSRLRGRGGAAYPTGTKWKLAAAASGSPKFVVANGDEGDPGSFIDRELMERDSHAILEGMAICAHAIGASRGVVFIRSEYPIASDIMSRAIRAAELAGFLGDNALGRGRPFHVEVVRGMGSYVCGEETALLSAIEGQRGEVRPRPPFPVESGLFGKPTVVDNVETLVNIPWMILRGADAYASLGSAESSGTKAVCFNRGFANPGIVEVEFGVTLRDVIEGMGGGGAGGATIEAVLLGGPMGSIVTPEQWDTPICFSAMAKRGITLGHAGLVAIHAPADWGRILQHLLTFMRDESCGKCVPCRLGSARAHEMARAGLTTHSRPEFERVMSLMKTASLCAFGRETPNPVMTILTRFGDRVVRGSTP